MKPATTGKGKNSYKKNNKIILKTFMIAIAFLSVVYSYVQLKQQFENQKKINNSLANQITLLKKSQDKQKIHLEAFVKEQTQKIDEIYHQQKQLTNWLNKIQKKEGIISNNKVDANTKTWLLVQTNFLMKLAGYILWNDRDAATAAILLKSADINLTNIDDPNFVIIHHAISEDIKNLSAVSQAENDSIILEVNKLSNQIDNLKLKNINNENSSENFNSFKLSDSLDEWHINLQKSWKNFIKRFITIQRRDEKIIFPMKQNKDTHLHEGIRSHLLAAEQAISCYQEEIYKQELNNVFTWIFTHCDTKDATTATFLNDIKKLSQQNISINIPNKLESQLILKKIIKTYMHDLMKSDL